MRNFQWKKLLAIVLCLVVICFFVLVHSLTETRVYFLALVKGPDQITWSDFSQFPHEDIGQGRLDYVYNLLSGSQLHIVGPTTDEPARTVMIDRPGFRLFLKWDIEHAQDRDRVSVE